MCPEMVYLHLEHKSSIFLILFFCRKYGYDFSKTSTAQKMLWQHCVMTSHRFEPVHNGHHDISSVVPLEIEEVDGADCPKVDAGEP